MLLCRPIPKAIVGRRARARMSDAHEEEALGKAYDSHLMRRLMQYMRPYKGRGDFAFLRKLAPAELALFPATVCRGCGGYEFSAFLDSTLQKTASRPAGP